MLSTVADQLCPPYDRGLLGGYSALARLPPSGSQPSTKVLSNGSGAPVCLLLQNVFPAHGFRGKLRPSPVTGPAVDSYGHPVYTPNQCLSEYSMGRV